jgi:hypothetical protein
MLGDGLSASKQKVKGDLLRTYSHNPNGLSCSNDNMDVKQFAKAIHAKDVALISLYEVNRNFELPTVLNSFHSYLRESAPNTTVRSLQRSCHGPLCTSWEGLQSRFGTSVFPRDLIGSGQLKLCLYQHIASAMERLHHQQ